MTQAVTVRRDGDAFQARLFWLHASDLLDGEGPIKRVGFETGPKGFDDIWVEFDPSRAPNDHYGIPLFREHIQCKWHVSPNSYGYEDLIDPAFINASARSFLQRAHEAQRQASNGSNVRFKLVTNWGIDRDDPLRELVSTRSGGLRLDRLFGTKTDNSKSGSVRKAWREHLDLSNEELGAVAQSLAFVEWTETLDMLRARLDKQFAYVGLRRIPNNESAFPYDDLAFQWVAQGRVQFDRDEFKSLCDQEKLIGSAEPRTIVYGIKSFEHPIDRLEDRCQNVLDFVPAFDERFIRSEADWQSRLYPELKEYLLGVAKDRVRLRLVLDAHTTLAFAAGSILNVKSGKIIELEQRTIGRQIWSADDCDVDPEWPQLQVTVEDYDLNQSDIVVALSITHDVSQAVRQFVEANGFDLAKFLHFTPALKPSSQAVKCGRHAFELVEQILKATLEARQELKSSGKIHLFSAAPNAFTFFLGQRQPALGKVVLYEYDFEGNGNRSYTPSISMPVVG